jgi:hypothetical protein
MGNLSRNPTKDRERITEKPCRIKEQALQNLN